MFSLVILAIIFLVFTLLIELKVKSKSILVSLSCIFIVSLYVLGYLNSDYDIFGNNLYYVSLFVPLVLINTSTKLFRIAFPLYFSLVISFASDNLYLSFLCLIVSFLFLVFNQQRNTFFKLFLIAISFITYLNWSIGSETIEVVSIVLINAVMFFSLFLVVKDDSEMRVIYSLILLISAIINQKFFGLNDSNFYILSNIITSLLLFTSVFRGTKSFVLILSLTSCVLISKFSIFGFSTLLFFIFLMLGKSKLLERVSLIVLILIGVFTIMNYSSFYFQFLAFALTSVALVNFFQNDYEVVYGN